MVITIACPAAVVGDIINENNEAAMSEQESKPPVLPVLNERERQELLQLARQAIAATVTNKAAAPETELDLQMQENAAVFVTLWQQEPPYSGSEGARLLRGCIGRLHPDLPLNLAVKNAAISAATRDPRFSPVQPDEVEGLIIEIAILSPLEEVDTLEDVVIGRDGLVIEAMNRRGLLLPKVATRLKWGRDDLLRNVCVKAGLPEDTWPGNGKLYKFSTTVFHD